MCAGKDHGCNWEGALSSLSVRTTQKCEKGVFLEVKTRTRFAIGTVEIGGRGQGGGGGGGD